MGAEVKRPVEFLLHRPGTEVDLVARCRKIGDEIVNVEIVAKEGGSKQERYLAWFRKALGGSIRRVQSFNRKEFTKEGWVGSKNFHIPAGWYNRMFKWAHEILLRK